MQDYRNLKIWQQGHQFVLVLYDITSHFPPEEKYGLVSQMRRAAVSIPANIAEGSAKNSDAEFGRFTTIAAGSAAELDYYLLLSRDLKFITDEQYATLSSRLDEIRRMLNSFIQRLKTKS